MAKQTFIKITDDLDGSEGAKTVKFGIDGDQFEIDLSDENHAKLKDFLSTYVAAGTKVSSARPQRGGSPAKSSREEMQRIRAWAKENGHNVNERGRISQAITEAYYQTH